jgi:tyrosinase
MVVAGSTYATFSSQIEGSPHSTPHVMIGGDMGGMRSPADPLFMMHHCNVDRLWAMWQVRPSWRHARECVEN